MLVQAILVGIWAGIAGVDKLVLQTHIHRPIVTGLIVGLILGDVNTGLITGATLELVWIGAVAIGGAQPPNVVIGGVIGTALAIITKSDPQVTVGLAVPFAVAAQALITLLYTAMSPIMHKFDAYAKKQIQEASKECLVFYQSFYSFVIFVVFLCIFFGADKASSFISILPEWSIHGLSVAGGMMPAVGFAMLLKTMWETSYVPFFIFGFVMAAYLGLDTLAVAGLAVAIALYEFYAQRNNTVTASNNNGGFEEDGI